MSEYTTKMREACILADVNLTHTSELETFKYVMTSESVGVKETTFSGSQPLVNDWQMKIHKLLKDDALFTEYQRYWFGFTYQQDKTKATSERIFNHLLVAFNKKFECKKSNLKRLENLFYLSARCVSYELYKGKKLLNQQELCEHLKITPQGFRKVLGEKYSWAQCHCWATDQLLTCDETMMILLAHEHYHEYEMPS